MKPKRCSHCGQVIPVPNPFQHQPVKRRIYDFVKNHPGGSNRNQIIDAVYADDPDGGPEHAATISMHVYQMRRVLNPLGLTITSPRGRGASFRLVEITKSA